MAPLRIAYFGLPLGALLLLRDGHQLVSCVLSPVAAPGRRRLRRCLSEDRVVDLLEGDVALGELEKVVERARPELVVSWFWTRQLSGRLLDLAPRGGIGAHPSLLPRHRGPNPYFAAIDAGDVETGVTIHRLTARYDDGDLLDRAVVSIGNDDAWQLARRLDRPSLSLIRRVTARLAEGELQGERQDETRATWAPEPEGELLHVDWHWPSERVLQRIRALSPAPGLGLELDAREFVVLRAVESRDFPDALLPGECAIVASEAAEARGKPDDAPEDAQARCVVVRTGSSAIRVVLAEIEVDGELRTVSGSKLAALLDA